MKPFSTWISAPMAEEALEMLVDGAHAQVTAAGRGTSARPKRPSSAPMR